MLLERPGKLVTREEIRRRLWPNDTIVEFENSINAAVRRLRMALHDSAEEPRLVKTLARRGYRFMAPVERVTRSSGIPIAGEPAPLKAVSPIHASELTGRKVSHYRVLEILGGGGMGVVYKAEDLKLGRHVALKFLPEELAGDRTALDRLEREARAVSTLNHPNICTIYELGEHDGQPFIVMELLEGETLRERIAHARLPGTPSVFSRRSPAGKGSGMRREKPRSALSFDETMDFALQIGAGLDAAHQKSIVHRDIKPANIFITNRGEAKILDFGLAKMTVGAGLAPPAVAPVYDRCQDDGAPFQGRLRAPLQDDVAGATVSTNEGYQDTPRTPAPDPHLTRTGVAMGTAHYMSPEQVRGEKLDARTDLFSFGLVLYEMATGQQAFAGDTAAEVHQAILQGKPAPARQLNPETPLKLEIVINKALEKDREKRYQSAAELQADLMRAKKEVGRARLWRRLKLTAIVMTVVAALLSYLFRPALPPPLLLPVAQVTFDGVAKSYSFPGLVTDGRNLYFNEWPSGRYSEIRLLQVPVTGGETAVVPTSLPNPLIADIAPDYSALLVLIGTGPLGKPRDRRLWLVPLRGGTDRPVGTVRAHGAAFSPDGRKIAYEAGNGLFVVRSDGTESHKILTVGNKTGNLRWSPDGRVLRYDEVPPAYRLGCSIWEVGEDGSGPHRLLPNWNYRVLQFGGVWTLDENYYLFRTLDALGNQWGSSLWTIREKGKLFRKRSREPVKLAAVPGHLGAYAPGLHGKTLFVTSSDARTRLMHYDAKSPRFVPYLDGISANSHGFSRDGQWIAYSSYPQGELWRSRLDGSEKLQLTSLPLRIGYPRWSPDGKQIAFDAYVEHDARLRIYLVPADGHSPPHALPGIAGESLEQTPDWSPDGTKVVFSGTPRDAATPGGVHGVHVLNLADGKLSTLPQSEGVSNPRWSPDGHYIAARSGDRSVVLLFDLHSQKWRPLAKFSTGFGNPEWSRDGAWIYLISLQPQARIIRVRPADSRAETVASLKGVRVRPYGVLAPDGSLVFPEDVSSDNIYALAWQ